MAYLVVRAAQRLAASRLVDELVRKGYVERRAHPRDARARLVVMTAAAEVVREWVGVVGEGEVCALWEMLRRIAPYGPIRPAW